MTKISPDAQGSGVPEVRPHQVRHNQLDARVLTGSEPLILRGFARDWPASVSWSWERLATAFAAITAQAEAVPAGRMSPAAFLASRREVRLPVGAFMAALGSDASRTRRTGPTFYLISTDTPTWAPALMSELPELASLLPNSARRPWSPAFTWRHCERVFFFGPAGTITHAHTDPQPGLLVQLLGYKTVHLAPPQATGRLRAIAEPLPASANRWLGVDLAALAEGEDAYAFGIRSGDLAPADALLIPAGWWHYVRASSAAVSVNYGWRSWCDLWGIRAVRRGFRAWRRP